MNTKDKLRVLFYDRAPNTLIFEHVKYEFPNENPQDLRKILNELVEEKFLEVKEELNDRYPEASRKGYHITKQNLGKYPIKKEIEIGDLKIPRLLDGDTARAEDINAISLSFDKIVSQKVQEIKESYKDELKKYWGTVVTVFGLFLVIFSMVNIAVKPIYFSGDIKLTQSQLPRDF